MKTFIFTFLAFGFTQAQSYRFVEPMSFKEVSSLPPKLELVLEVFCNEELTQVIRHEATDPQTKKVTLAVGALVQENLLSSCAGKKKKITVDAGTTFSGRPYEVVRIKK